MRQISDNNKLIVGWFLVIVRIFLSHLAERLIYPSSCSRCRSETKPLLFGSYSRWQRFSNRVRTLTVVTRERDLIETVL